MWSKDSQQGWTKKQRLIKQSGPHACIFSATDRTSGIVPFWVSRFYFLTWPCYHDSSSRFAHSLNPYFQVELGSSVFWLFISSISSGPQLSSTLPTSWCSLSHHLICNQSSRQHQCICGRVCTIEVRIKCFRDFPSGPMLKIPHSQCRGPGFDPWSGNSILHATTKTWCSQVNI